jgi:hypothetical protein
MDEGAGWVGMAPRAQKAEAQWSLNFVAMNCLQIGSHRIWINSAVRRRKPPSEQVRSAKTIRVSCFPSASSVDVKKPFVREKLQMLMEALPIDVLRVKGVLFFTDDPGRGHELLSRERFSPLSDRHPRPRACRRLGGSRSG